MSEMQAAVLPVTPLQQNCSLIWCSETKKAAVIDPGGDVDRIREALEEQGLTLEKVLLTHGHFDHAGGAAELAEAYGVPVEGPQEDEKFLLDAIEMQGFKWGVAGGRNVEPDRWLNDGDKVSVGNLTLDVVHCPGHTPGHVVFFHEPSRFAVVGDVLFKGSIGRTDFPRGDHDTLIRSIKEKLLPLGDDVTFLPGHGPLSNFGSERRTNPFLVEE
ncbi:MAG: MBL fold metallo-hydrolase [Hyphomicrobiales bacterium]